ncbi:BON domain-containing protein [Paraburkholderia sp. A2WS-5]|uniref:BON domain-containing protein n=1 Tax=unclassified Paraburkholderia TaxID=2615204 RepID=UPI003B7A6894
MNTSFRLLRTLTMAMFAVLAANVFAQTPNPCVNDAPPASTAQPSPATKTADRKLARQVARALAHTRGLISGRILVKAHDGLVTLSGSVVDATQIPLAVEAAKQVAGVKDVDNQIRVSGAPL